MASGNLKTLTEGTFNDEIRTGLVLVDFWAEWCAPCRTLAPTVDALAAEFEGRATVAKLNIDQNPNVPSRLSIRGIRHCSSSRTGRSRRRSSALHARKTS